MPDREAELLNSNAELRARISRLEAHSSRPASERTALAAVHQRAERLGQLHGVPIGPPTPGENLAQFQARAFQGFTEHSPTWRGADLAGLSGDALHIACDQVEREATRAVDLTRGPLRKIETVDPYSGRKEIRWYGDPSDWLEQCTTSPGLIKYGKLGEVHKDGPAYPMKPGAPLPSWDRGR